jgi:hypothetical protein
MNRLTVKINNDKTSIVAISITDPTVKKAEVGQFDSNLQ